VLALALIQVNMRPKSQAWPVKDGEDRFAISGCSRKRQEQARAPRQIRRDSTGANQASRAELITAALGVGGDPLEAFCPLVESSAISAP